MSKELHGEMKQELAEEIATMALNQDKPFFQISNHGKPLFTIYEVIVENRKWFALLADEEIYRALSLKSKSGRLLLISSEEDIVKRELAKYFTHITKIGLAA